MPNGPSREIESSSTPADRVSETGLQSTSPARSNSPGPHTQWLYKFLFWLCLTVLLAVSLIPDISFNQEFTPLGIRKDYALHYLGYAALGFMCLKTWSETRKALLFLLLFAILSELVQFGIEGRLVQIEDLISNLLGVATGIVFFVGWKVGKRSR